MYSYVQFIKSEPLLWTREARKKRENMSTRERTKDEPGASAQPLLAVPSETSYGILGTHPGPAHRAGDSLIWAAQELQDLNGNMGTQALSSARRRSAHIAAVSPSADTPVASRSAASVQREPETRDNLCGSPG